MPFEQHPSFPPPSDPHVKLWRYMDFMKLFALLETSTLYFPSAYQLSEQDPFEGSFTAYHANYQLTGTVGEGTPSTTWMTERNAPPPDWEPDEWHYLQEIDLQRRRHIRRYMFINSWNMNDNESLAMWKLYNLSGDGLAIVSRFDKLQESLADNEEKPFVGHVQYIDYEKNNKWLGNYFDPFMHKTIELEHEQEVRVVVWGFHNVWRDYWESLWYKREREYTDPPLGISLRCDLEKLIECVVVSPTAPQWVFEMISKYCQKTIGKEARRSKLTSGPYF